MKRSNQGYFVSSSTQHRAGWVRSACIKAARVDRARALVAALFATVLLLACASTPKDQATNGVVAAQPATAQASMAPPDLPESDVSRAARDVPAFQPPAAPPSDAVPVSSNRGTKVAPSEVELYPAQGEMINRDVALALEEVVASGADITLNFENTDLVEVVKTVLGDILGENYVVDPGVIGAVTVSTGSPIPRASLIPTLEMLLRMNDAALVRVGGLYKVVPVSQAVRGNLSPRISAKRGSPGFGVRIIPLRYIGAVEMQKVLEPFVPEGALIRVDTARNLLMLAGTADELERIESTVATFDVNWLEGMSVGIYPLDVTDPEIVVGELEKVFGQDSETPLAGLFRFIAIERLSSVLVITSQREYLEQAKQWVERLDRAADEAIGGQRLYVYAVQNGEAEYLAGLLNDVFGGDQGGDRDDDRRTVAPGAVAPGFEPASLNTERVDELAAEQRKVEEAADKAQDAASSDVEVGDVRVIADSENNILLILASPTDYRKIEVALRKLDITPLQVLVETTIAEVTLSDELEYGLQWFFKNDVGDKSGVGTFNTGLDGSARPGIQPLVGTGGFSYALFDSAGMIRALLEALAQDSRVRIISSPSIMVIDSKTANIRVGDQVPVETGSTVTDGGNTTTQVQFRDTGVLLEVTPRVNQGGLVTMDISQEVTDVGERVALSLGTFSTTFLKREFTSTVAIQSDDTLVLGGLIRENTNEVNQGVPVLYKMPLVGPLFGVNEEQTRRTELVVLITPRVISNEEDADRIMDDLGEKMRRVLPFGRNTDCSNEPGCSDLNKPLDY